VVIVPRSRSLRMGTPPLFSLVGNASVLDVILEILK
jgi:hypothetical protein